MVRWWLVLPIFLIVALVQAAPSVTVPRIEDGRLELDGVLDEEPWGRAAKLNGFHQYQPVDGRPAEEQTEVLVWYSPTALYFGILAKDRDPGSIRATVAERDRLERDDTVVIYLDTFNDRRRAFFFEVNPLGVQQDGVLSEGQQAAGDLYAGSTDKNPDYQFDSRGRLTADGYCVEIRIPFKSLRYPGNGPQKWGINIMRTVQRTGYQDTWTDVRRASASFLAQAGFIEGLHDLQRGLVVEVQPFATLVANGSRESTGDFTRESPDTNPGVNVRLGLTNLSLDATVNPDFSQVESDAGQVTVNERFALYYPEKRPFFLEGIELFATPNQLVYTRQIADPIGGAKVTGKLGRFGIAYLSAVDDGGDSNAAFNILRMRRDLGTDSLVGLTYTDRTGAGDDYNRVLAGDLRWVFAKLYFIQAQLGGSWTREQDPATSSPIWELQFDRTGRAWGFNYRLAGIGESFVTRSGYVPRNNIVDGHAFNRYSWYGKPGALVEKVDNHFIISGIWSYAGGLGNPALEGGENLESQFHLRGGWTATGKLTNSFYRFDQNSYTGYTVISPDGSIQPYVAPEEMTGVLSYSVALATPTYQMMDASIEIAHGDAPIFAEASEGRGTEVTGTIGLRPNASIRIEASTIFSELSRRRDDSEFARTIIPRLKVEYQPRRSLFFRVVGEYRTQRQAALQDAITGALLYINGLPSQEQSEKNLRLDWLFSYEPTPGTAVYFGYGTTYEDIPNFTDLQRTNDGFFVKVAYMFRR